MFQIVSDTITTIIHEIDKVDFIKKLSFSGGWKYAFCRNCGPMIREAVCLISEKKWLLVLKIIKLKYWGIRKEVVSILASD